MFEYFCRACGGTFEMGLYTREIERCPDCLEWMARYIPPVDREFEDA